MNAWLAKPIPLGLVYCDRCRAFGDTQLDAGRLFAGCGGTGFMQILGRGDRGSMLVDYLGVSESRLSQGVERMIADGKYELAASTLDWARDRYPGSARLESMERVAYLKLVEKYQQFNPFKFIVYSGKGGLDLPQLDPATATRAVGTPK